MAEPVLAHIVYFTLKDKSEAAQQKLVDDCYTYLKPHDGVVFFAAGRLAADLDREVNVQDFQVALHVFFQNRAMHDAYQVSDAHNTFIEENKDNWEKVRVYDSMISDR